MWLWSEGKRAWVRCCLWITCFMGPGSITHTTSCAAKQNIPWKLSFFLGCLRERLHFWLARENNRSLFWYSGPQTTPESPALCHQRADEYKDGLNLGPDAALWTRSPRPPSILSQTLFHNSHPSNIQQREYQHNQSYVCSFLSPPQPQCPVCPCNSPLSLLFLVKKNK